MPETARERQVRRALDAERIVKDLTAHDVVLARGPEPGSVSYGFDPGGSAVKVNGQDLQASNFEIKIDGASFDSIIVDEIAPAGFRFSWDGPGRDFSVITGLSS